MLSNKCSGKRLALAAKPLIRLENNFYSMEEWSGSGGVGEWGSGGVGEGRSGEVEKNWKCKRRRLEIGVATTLKNSISLSLREMETVEDPHCKKSPDSFYETCQGGEAVYNMVQTKTSYQVRRDIQLFVPRKRGSYHLRRDMELSFYSPL